MSCAETRSLHPDWHKRPVRWVVDGRTPHRVASGDEDEIDRCLPDYRPDITATNETGSWGYDKKTKKWFRLHD